MNVSPATPLNRRRHRVVVVIAVLLAGMYFWTLSLDRFEDAVVGTWTVDSTEAYVPDVFVFHPDHKGFKGVLYPWSKTPHAVQNFHWWADGTELLVQDTASRSTTQVDFMVKKVAALFTGASRSGSLGRFRIRRVSENEVVIDYSDPTTQSRAPLLLRHLHRVDKR
jgi:hypothetical protein